MTDATGSGTWSSTNTAVGTVSGGVVTGVAAGTTTISYTITSGCGTVAATRVVTVNPLPNAGSITGATPVCVGATTTLTDATVGGAWSSTNTAVGTVSGGAVRGITAGTTTISYTVTSGCGAVAATAVLTVNPLPNAGSITGTATVCIYATTALTDITGSGVWSTGAASVASVNTAGLVTGVDPGTATISYTVTNSCGNVSAIQVVTVNGSAAYGFTGPSNVNVGASITLVPLMGGGVWSASNSNATVTAGTGIVTGVTVGTVTISYTLDGVCGTTYSTAVITVNNSLLPGINGNTSICLRATSTLSDVTTGGTWSSSNVAIAAVGAATGVVTTAAVGTAIITYTQGGAYTTVTVTVNANPLPVQGVTSECAGTTITLTDNTSGGTWTGSGDVSIVSVGVNSVSVTAGAAGGSGTITYTISDGCYTTYPNTVYSNPSAIFGPSIVCIGSSTILSDSTATSVSWTSSNTLVATVLNTGHVTGVAAGTAIITYKALPGNCIATMVVSVTGLPASISGNIPVCAGSLLNLTDVAGAGTWSSSSTSIASIGSATGVLTAVAGGTATISYISGTSGCMTTSVVTVNPILPINGGTSVCTGTTTSLSDASAGGTWLSGNTGIATVGLTTGLVTGVSNGAVPVTYTIASGCIRITTVNVGVMTPILGSMAVCASASATLTDVTTGGKWTISNTLLATIGSASGIVTAAATAGTATVSYALAGCTTTRVLTVNANPLPVQGAISECAGTTVTLTDNSTGGTWSASGDVTIGATGILTAGAAPGTATVTYTFPTGCYITYPNTVIKNPTAIFGALNVCQGAVTILSDSSATGVSWTSSNTLVATVLNTGHVTGVATGTATITYKALPGNCITTQVVTVNALPSVTPIVGATSIAVGTPATITEATPGGVWASSHSSVIALSGSTGSSVTATALATSGFAAISYAVTNVAGCTTTVTLTVTATPAPPPHGGGISGTTTLLVGATVYLADDLQGGVWSSSDNDVATVGQDGSVTAVKTGNANIKHVITNDQGDVTTSISPVMVTAFPSSVSILPNPNKGTFTVKGTLGNSNDEEVTMEVTDLLGQVIYKNKVTALNGKLNETITLSNTLANGIYILSVESDTQHKTLHFVIEQ